MGHRARKTLHRRGVANRHGHLQPGTDSGGLRGHHHGYRAAPFLVDPTADWGPLAAVQRNRTAFVLRPSIPVPDGSSAIRFEFAGCVMQLLGGTTERPVGCGSSSGCPGTGRGPLYATAAEAHTGDVVISAPAWLGYLNRNVNSRGVNHI